jgi:hypothetical protein
VLQGGGLVLAPAGFPALGSGTAPLLAGHAYAVTIPVDGGGVRTRAIRAGRIRGRGPLSLPGRAGGAHPRPASALLFGLGGFVLAAWCWMRKDRGL